MALFEKLFNRLLKGTVEDNDRFPIGGNGNPDKNVLASVLNNYFNPYIILGGVIRYYSSIGAWDLIQNQEGNHPPRNILSVTSDAFTITINFDVAGPSPGAGVTDFLACPDEDFASKGLFMGCSVNRTQAFLKLYRNFSDYVYYDGADWLSVSGKVTLTWDTNHLKITDTNFEDGGSLKEFNKSGDYAYSLTGRNGGYIPFAGATSLNNATIYFYDFSGTLITVPDTSMKCYVSWNNPIQLNPNNFGDGFGNIWFHGQVPR